MRFVYLTLIALLIPVSSLSCTQAESRPEPEMMQSVAGSHSIKVIYEGMVTFARHLTNDTKFVEVYFPGNREPRIVEHRSSWHLVEAHIPALLFNPADVDSAESNWPYHTRSSDGQGFVFLKEWIVFDFDRRTNDEPDFGGVDYLGKLSEALSGTRRKDGCVPNLVDSDPRNCRSAARLRLDVGQFADEELLKDDNNNNLKVTFTDNGGYMKFMARTIRSAITAQDSRPLTICTKAYEDYINVPPDQRMQFLRTCGSSGKKLVFENKDIEIRVLNVPLRTILGLEPPEPTDNIAYHYDLHFDLTSVAAGDRRFPKPYLGEPPNDEKICPPSEIE